MTNRTPGVPVTVPFFAGVLIYMSRGLKRLGLNSAGRFLLRRAGAMTPGIRMQIWNARKEQP
jgi:hypothetical protein